MNARGKLNGLWCAVAILIGLIVVGTVGSDLVFLVVVAAVILFAIRGGNIR